MGKFEYYIISRVSNLKPIVGMQRRVVLQLYQRSNARNGEWRVIKETDEGGGSEDINSQWGNAARLVRNGRRRPHPPSTNPL